MTNLDAFRDYCKQMFVMHADRVERAESEADRLEGERLDAVRTLRRVEAERDALKRQIDALAPELMDAQLRGDDQKVVVLQDSYRDLVSSRERLRLVGLEACDRLDAVPSDTAIRSGRSREIGAAKEDADALSKELHRIVDEERERAGFPTVEQRRKRVADKAADVVATRPVVPLSWAAPASGEAGGESYR